jgi:hypothetical protein
VHAGRCILERVVVNTTAAGTVVIYDNLAGSGMTVARFPASPAAGTYEYGCLCNTGVTVVTTAALDLTVVVTQFATPGAAPPAPPPPPGGDSFLLESGSFLLLESGGHLLLE